MKQTYNKVHIYDLDGTLVDSSHRYRTDANGRTDIPYWQANAIASKVSQDTLLPLSSQYKQDLSTSSTYVIIITARVLTQYCYPYIEKNLGIPNILLSRDESDCTTDYLLKVKQINKVLRIPALFSIPKFFWDDNINNVLAFAALGINSTYVHSKQGHSKINPKIFNSLNLNKRIYA